MKLIKSDFVEIWLSTVFFIAISLLSAMDNNDIAFRQRCLFGLLACGCILY